MQKLPVVLSTLLLLTAVLSAQKPADLNRSAIGVQVGYFNGTPKFKNLERTAFDAYNGINYGIFARLHIYNGYFLQPEVNLFKRQINGQYQYLLGGATAISVDQQVVDFGLLVHKSFGKGRIRPFVTAGMSIGTFKEKSAQEIFDPSTAQLYQLEFRSNDTNGVLEAGAQIQLPFKLDLSLAGRYYLAANNVRFFDTHSANMSRWHLNIALAKRF